ncbi:MAG: osmoprotectant NAGGN system M42 family peptidase [Desulfotignum sp.]
MSPICLDETFLIHQIKELLSIPSPAGYSDQVVHYVGNELEKLGIDFEVTRRGSIRATLPGTQNTLDRAVTVHLDTLGAMVSQLKDNGKLGITPIGNWSSRFAEGGRVTVFTQAGPKRGTVLPLKASGHAWGDAVDSLPVSWDHVELRVDEICNNQQDLADNGFDIGDIIAFDALPEITENGFINARYLDDKAGVAILLTVAKALAGSGTILPVDCHLIFTIFEEIGFGASADIYADVSEMVVIDLAPVAPDQNSSEYAAAIAMKDQTGPFDYHLSRKLVQLCQTCHIDFRKDVFRYYRSDAASAIEAGHDVRTALVGFGVDASHGYERTHLSALTATARLICEYIQSEPTFAQDPKRWASLAEFPHQPDREIIKIKT